MIWFSEDSDLGQRSAFLELLSEPKIMVFAFDNYNYTSAHIGSHLVTRTAIGRHRYRTEPSALVGG